MSLERVAERYRGEGHFARHYVAGKLRFDPVSAALIDLAGPGSLGAVVDLGCGRGQFGAMLLETGAATSVIGVDFNQASLEQAASANRRSPYTALHQDLSRDQAVPDGDTILLIDVLYQLNSEAQAALLRNAANAARRLLVIRTADPARGLRSLLTQGLEVAFRTLWPHSGAMVNPLSPEAMRDMLCELGFSCTLAPCWAGTPFSNVLLVGRKEEGSF